MGACDFTVIGIGPSAATAFRRAHDAARYESGHGGYTGTIAEKPGFKLVPVPEGVDPKEFADWALHGRRYVRVEVQKNEQWNEMRGGKYYRYDEMPIPEEHAAAVARVHEIAWDKWGEAACVALGGDKYLFFGLASS